MLFSSCVPAALLFKKWCLPGDFVVLVVWTSAEGELWALVCSFVRLVVVLVVVGAQESVAQESARQCTRKCLMLLRGRSLPRGVQWRYMYVVELLYVLSYGLRGWHVHVTVKRGHLPHR